MSFVLKLREKKRINIDYLKIKKRTICEFKVRERTKKKNETKRKNSLFK